MHPICSLALPQIPRLHGRIGVPFFHAGWARNCGNGQSVVVPAKAAEKVVALLKRHDDKESKMLPIIEREKSMLKVLEIYNRN